MSRSAQNVSPSCVILNNTTWHHDMIINIKNANLCGNFSSKYFVLRNREMDFVSMPICFWVFLTGLTVCNSMYQTHSSAGYISNFYLCYCLLIDTMSWCHVKNYWTRLWFGTPMTLFRNFAPYDSTMKAYCKSTYQYFKKLEYFCDRFISCVRVTWALDVWSFSFFDHEY